jgi:hypothetical protein
VENLWGDRKEWNRQPSLVEKAVDDENNYCFTTDQYSFVVQNIKHEGFL